MEPAWALLCTLGGLLGTEPFLQPLAPLSRPSAEKWGGGTAACPEPPWWSRETEDADQTDAKPFPALRPLVFGESRTMTHVTVSFKGAQGDLGGRVDPSVAELPAALS